MSQPRSPRLSESRSLPVVTEYTAEVAACPGHVWRLEERTPEGMSVEASLKMGDWYTMDVCQVCRAVRCDRYIDGGASRCLEPRHHDHPHRFPTGAVIEVGA